MYISITNIFFIPFLHLLLDFGLYFFLSSILLCPLSFSPSG